MAKAKSLPYALMDKYVAAYSNKFGRKPEINRYREKWGFGDMIESIGYERSLAVIEFYFLTSQDIYSPAKLFNTFDKLDVALAERDADRAKRTKVREETERRVREWESRNES
jgi:hypothetical protein